MGERSVVFLLHLKGIQADWLGILKMILEVVPIKISSVKCYWDNYKKCKQYIVKKPFQVTELLEKSFKSHATISSFDLRGRLLTKEIKIGIFRIYVLDRELNLEIISYDSKWFKTSKKNKLLFNKIIKKLKERLKPADVIYDVDRIKGRKLRFWVEGFWFD